MRPLIGPTTTRARGGEYVPRQSYTSAWTTGGTQPAIGNGTLAADYEVRGKVLHVNVKLTAGSTTTFGTGTWRFSLPSGYTAARDSVGDALIIDASPAAVYIGGALAASGATFILATSSSGNVSGTIPITFAQSDTMTIDMEVAI